MKDSPDQERYLVFSWLHNNYEKHIRFCMGSYRLEIFFILCFVVREMYLIIGVRQIWHIL